MEDPCRIVTKFVQHYNEVRLHSAICYVTPMTKLAGEEKQVFDSHDEKLKADRLKVKQKPCQQEWEKSKRNEEENCNSCYNEQTWSEDKAMLGSNLSAASSL